MWPLLAAQEARNIHFEGDPLFKIIIGIFYVENENLIWTESATMWMEGSEGILLFPRVQNQGQHLFSCLILVQKAIYQWHLNPLASLPQNQSSSAYWNFFFLNIMHSGIESLCSF